MQSSSLHLVFISGSGRSTRTRRRPYAAADSRPNSDSLGRLHLSNSNSYPLPSSSTAPCRLLAFPAHFTRQASLCNWTMAFTTSYAALRFFFLLSSFSRFVGASTRTGSCEQARRLTVWWHRIVEPLQHHQKHQNPSQRRRTTASSNCINRLCRSC